MSDSERNARALALRHCSIVLASTRVRPRLNGRPSLCTVTSTKLNASAGAPIDLIAETGLFLLATFSALASGRSDDTYVPEPLVAEAYPSARSCSYAATTAARDIASSL